VGPAGTGNAPSPEAMSIDLQRAYDHDPLQGSPKRHRFLVDRLWPRGIKKAALSLEGWVKDVAPSDRLRQWFGHDPRRWPGFVRRYGEELDEHPETWMPLLDVARHGRLTLVFGARDIEHNNAVALKEYLDGKLAGRGAQKARRAS
jgi:uncharacterized protein YeaO (DUF488 family)